MCGLGGLYCFCCIAHSSPSPAFPGCCFWTGRVGTGTNKISLLASDRAFHYSDHRTWMWSSRRARGQGTYIYLV